MKKGRITSSSMQSILDDVLLKILIILAFRSLRGLFSTNMVLKKFNEIVEGPYIYQHMNITNFETVNPFKSRSTSYTVSKFINRCIQCGNLQTLYMVGKLSSETTRKKP
ncbi:hypothetical protein D8674_037510 [Pyrus ussuriensis x Pyrus communis]|uniref:F-box protein n=1 Tax=Pyrus ussuriensis x Pyrus communis TaxID=2448454 RepID=A0A5N5GG36_9ROSA|nr:hypothetical protein D8674_037510 [Pyrus ussuriensis x Pyrus communis]